MSSAFRTGNRPSGSKGLEFRTGNPFRGAASNSNFRPPDIPSGFAAFLPISPGECAAKVVNGSSGRTWSAKNRSAAFSRVFGSIAVDSSQQNQSHLGPPMSGGLKLYPRTPSHATKKHPTQPPSVRPPHAAGAIAPRCAERPHPPPRHARTHVPPLAPDQTRLRPPSKTVSTTTSTSTTASAPPISSASKPKWPGSPRPTGPSSASK
jgi:hypothetical protein